MKIKYEKFSFELTPKDMDWFIKLSQNDQLKILFIAFGGFITLNITGMAWYKTITSQRIFKKEENEKSKALNNDVEIKVKKEETKKELIELMNNKEE